MKAMKMLSDCERDAVYEAMRSMIASTTAGGKNYTPSSMTSTDFCFHVLFSFGFFCRRMKIAPWAKNIN